MGAIFGYFDFFQVVASQQASVMIQTGFFTLLLLVAATTLGQATLAIGQHKGLIVCGNSLGCLKGVYMPGYQIKRFEAYLGIPYALPPLGELRFSVSWRL